MTIESSVRSYCRNFPAIFTKANGCNIWDTEGTEFIDFLSACGSLNYGHNHPVLKEKLIEYIASDGIAMSLDMYTSSKDKFLQDFSRYILSPSNLDYKVQFPGPTGTNAVEAAIKLSRKVTGRSNVVSFTNGFHGCSLGALALTGNSHHREASQSHLTHVNRFAYDNYFGENIDTAAQLDQMLSDPSGGIDKPAAIIFEAIQGEGGMNTASSEWAQTVQKIAKDHGALLIIDDIQAGCGRSGDFFSFEALGIDPDIVVLAKSISGFGLPMSLVLLKPELDHWLPGEHNGTFRGNNHAFVTAQAALELFWKDEGFKKSINAKACLARDLVHKSVESLGLKVKGRGLMLGIDYVDPNLTEKIQAECFSRCLIVETCGPKGEILKLLPPLVVSDELLKQGLEIVDKATKACLSKNHPASPTQLSANQ